MIGGVGMRSPDHQRKGRSMPEHGTGQRNHSPCASFTVVPGESSPSACGMQYARNPAANNGVPSAHGNGQAHANGKADDPEGGCEVTAGRT